MAEKSGPTNPSKLSLSISRQADRPRNLLANLLRANFSVRSSPRDHLREHSNYEPLALFADVLTTLFSKQRLLTDRFVDEHLLLVRVVRSSRSKVNVECLQTLPW